MIHPASSSFLRAFLTILFFLITIFQADSQWTLQVSGTNYPLHTVYFLNNSTGLLTSNSNILPQFLGGEIIRTTNGGDNWQRVLLDSNFRAKGFYFFDANTGFAVGGSYATQGYIYKSTNGGINWIDVTPNPLSTHLFNLVFPNSATGYVSGTGGVLKTTNAGNNWILALSTPISGYIPVARVYFLDVNTGFYVRDTISVYKTTNAGINWQLTQLTTTPLLRYLRDIKFIDNITGYIVGDGGVLFKTTNQGANWVLQPVPISQDFFSIFFADINTGYITAEHTVLKTTNGGVNWFSVFSFPADTLFSSFFLNANTGYVCGDEGRVYKTTTGGVIGIRPISNEVPKEFMLYQNYPNPFNPATTIKFAIAKSSNVKILLFDAIGREVETLVNENINPGIYEVSWDASKFSSGIYFYKIITSEYTSVKKMSIIK